MLHRWYDSCFNINKYMDMEKTEITVIGAGVVGLATAARLAREGRDVTIIERHRSFGQEASSRNSEVIHAGVYYDRGSLKSRLCLEGNRLMYETCREANVPHAAIGKLIVAADQDEIPMLEALFERAKENGAEDLRLITGEEALSLEPHVRAVAAIHAPTSGIVDSHALMKYFETTALSRGAKAAYGCEVRKIEKTAPGFEVEVLDADGDAFTFQSEIVINSAGMSADKVAAMAGMDIEEAGYKINYFKGVYFTMPPKKAPLTKMLIYPVPPFLGSVGIHTVPDLAGQNRLGPYSRFVDEVDYDVEAGCRDHFYNSVKKFLPFIEPGDLEPGTAGIQAKLQEKGGPQRDFVITNERDRGLDGLINLVGIDSPGLTSCMAIAREVAGLI